MNVKWRNFEVSDGGFQSQQVPARLEEADELLADL